MIPPGDSNDSFELELKTLVQPLWGPHAFESTGEEGSYCAGSVIDPDYEGNLDYYSTMEYV